MFCAIVVSGSNEGSGPSPATPRDVLGVDSPAEDSDDRAHGGDSPTPIQGNSEDLDDDNMEGEDSQEIISPVAAMLNEHSGQDAAVEVRDDAVQNLRASHRDVAVVKKSVTAELDTFPWLQSMWGLVIDLPPTNEMIVTSWNYLVDLLAASRARKPTTGTAPTFTMSRFETWPDRLRTWINHESVQEVARTRQDDKGTHYLSCIINIVDEELYRVFVEEARKNGHRDSCLS
ncbi:unnamed protein product [Ectocarpus fasciculatus]